MPVRRANERVRTRGGVQANQNLEFLDGFFRFTRHEVTLAERRVEIGATRRDVQTRFEERDGIFKIILRHADARQKEDNVRILRRELVVTYQQVESFDGPGLATVNLREEIQRFRGIEFQ